VQLGKVYGNRSDVAITDKKPRDRALRICKTTQFTSSISCVNTGTKWQLGKGSCTNVMDGFEAGLRSPFSGTQRDVWGSCFELNSSNSDSITCASLLVEILPNSARAHLEIPKTRDLGFCFIAATLWLRNLIGFTHSTDFTPACPQQLKTNKKIYLFFCNRDDHNCLWFIPNHRLSGDLNGRSLSLPVRVQVRLGVTMKYTRSLEIINIWQLKALIPPHTES